jgi:O-antigen ligase
MKIMELSKSIIGKIGLKDSRLKIGVLIIAAEIFVGFLCLATGLYAFLFIFAILLTLLIFLYPKIGLIIMLFLMPNVDWLRFDIGPVTITPFRIILIPTLIGVLLHIVVYKPRITMAPIAAPVIALISIAIMSIVQSSHVGIGLFRLVFFLSIFATTFVVAQLIDDKKWVKIAVGTLIASSSVLIVIALTQGYFGYQGVSVTAVTGGHRLFGKHIGSLYAGPHLFAADLTVYLPFALVLSAISTRLKSIFFVLLILSFIAGILLSAAMAGWLAAAASLSVLAILGFTRKQYRGVIGVLKWLVVIILLATILVAAIVPTPILIARFERFADILSFGGPFLQSTLEVRTAVYAAAKKILADRPILGVGLGSLFYEYYKYQVAAVGAPGKKFTHRGFNVFIDIGTEMGILGIGAFLWFIIACAWYILKYLPLITDPFLANLLLASFIGCVAVFIQMQSETGNFWNNSFWVLLGLALAIINISKSSGYIVEKQNAIGQT